MRKCCPSVRNIFAKLSVITRSEFSRLSSHTLSVSYSAHVYACVSGPPCARAPVHTAASAPPLADPPVTRVRFRLLPFHVLVASCFGCRVVTRARHPWKDFASHAAPAVSQRPRRRPFLPRRWLLWPFPLCPFVDFSSSCGNRKKSTCPALGQTRVEIALLPAPRDS